MKKRVVSSFLILILLCNIFSTIFIPVYGAKLNSANQMNAAMINFFKGQTELAEPTSVSDEELRVYALFISNFMELGYTQLKDLNGNIEKAYGGTTSLAASVANKFNKTGSDVTTVATLNSMVYQGSLKSMSMLVDSNSKKLSGSDFLLKMALDSDTKVYFKPSNSDRTETFDLKDDVVRASLKIWAGQSTDFILGKNGIAKMSGLYLDCWGNIWGEYTANLTANGSTDLIVTAVENYVLVLPACMNPNSFYNTSSKANSNLKIPLTNSFALGSLMYANKSNLQAGYSAENKNIPYYNLPSYITSGNTDKFNNTNIFLMSSPTDYVLNSVKMAEDSQNKKLTTMALAFELYNYYKSELSGNTPLLNSKDKLVIANNISKGASYIDNDFWGKGEAETTEELEITKKEKVFNYLYSSMSVPYIREDKKLNVNSNIYYGSALEGEGAENFFSQLGLVGYNLFTSMEGGAEDKKTNNYLNSNYVTATPLNEGLKSFYDIVSAILGETNINTATKFQNSVVENIIGSTTGSPTLIDALMEDEEFSNLSSVPVGLENSTVESIRMYIPLNKKDAYKEGILALATKYAPTSVVPKWEDEKNLIDASVSNADYGYLDLLNVNRKLSAIFSLIGLSQGEYADTRYFIGDDIYTSPSYLSGLNGKYSQGPGTDIKTLEEIDLDNFRVLGWGTWSKAFMYGAFGLTGGSLLSVLGADSEKGVMYTAFAVDSINDRFVNYRGEGSNLEYWNSGLAFYLKAKSVKKESGSGLGLRGLFRYTSSDLWYYHVLNNYRVYGPSVQFKKEAIDANTYKSISIDTSSDLGNLTVHRTTSRVEDGDAANWMGVFFGYLVEVTAMKESSEVKEDKDGNVKIIYDLTPFTSNRLPSMPKGITTGGTLNIVTDGESGVAGNEEASLEKMKVDMLKKINGILSEDSNDYRNTWIKSVLDGFLVSTHRAITGSWVGGVSTVSTGGSSTYASVVGFINTPSLKELSFTSWVMQNYIQIYIFALLIVLLILIFMVLLHIRSWKQGVAIFLVMCLALLMPNILIENTINIGNKITDSIYSDRFDYWAIIQHMQSYKKLSEVSSNKASQEYIIANSMEDAKNVYNSDAGVRIKWMSPKKLNNFYNLYTNQGMTQNVATNLKIFKWLFSSFIFESEFESSDAFATYVYRPYNSIASEAKDMYEAYYEKYGEISDIERKEKITENVNGLVKTVSKIGLREKTDYLYAELSVNKELYLQENDSKRITISGTLIPLYYSNTKLLDILYVRPTAIEKPINKYSYGLSDTDITNKVNNSLAVTFGETVPYWGIGNSLLNETISNSGSIPNTSLLFTLDNMKEVFDTSNFETMEMQAYFKNTEGPYYYFYNVLKSRYSRNKATGTGFKNSLLNSDNFLIPKSDTLANNTKEKNKLGSTQLNIGGTVRDFLDLEGLFTVIIPYMSDVNDFVYEWTSINGTTVPDYSFEADSDAKTRINTFGSSSEDIALEQSYIENQNLQAEMAKIWGIYSPWVDQLNSLDIYNQKAGIAGKKIRIENSLNPSSYIKKGRPMIFSEADMVAKGYNEKDLTNIEQRIQTVLTKTYTDLMYLINYYDMDDEVLISAAAMYATFNFNAEFSQSRWLGESTMLYPQAFEMKNFNYDAFMRLMLMNSTGESVFASKDLYVSMLGKTSFITGVMLLIVDVMAVIIIPTMKLIILLMLFFLGILLCITCVVSPPEKLLKAIGNSLVIPAILFLIGNVGFAFLVSILVGDGLSQYVGSKTLSIATNDPTITIGVLMLLSGVYIFVLFKLIKKTWKSMKEYGLNTILGTIGIATAGFTSLAGHVGGAVSRLGSAAVGAATAGKGNRLAGAADGFANKDILSKNADARRTARALNSGSNHKSPLSDSDAEIAKRGKGNSEDSSEENGKKPEKKSKSDAKLDRLYNKKDKLNETKHNMKNALNGMKPSEIVKRAQEKSAKKQAYRDKKEKEFLSADYKRAKTSGLVPIGIKRASKIIKKESKKYKVNNPNSVAGGRYIPTRNASEYPTTNSSINYSTPQVKGKKKDNTSVKKKNRRKKNGKNGNNSGNNYGKPKS